MSLADLFGSDGPEPTPALPLDEFLDAVRSERRRLVLKVLANLDEWIELDDLSRLIGSMEESVPESDITGAVYKKYYVSMYQTHVPALEDQGLIATTDRGNEISITPAGRHALDVLATVESELGGDQ